MNWNAVDAIGSILGAIAVVVSLVYLAAQIRAQNIESRLAARHSIAAEWRDCLLPFSDPQLAQLFTRVNKGDEPLEDSEMLQLIVTIVRFFSVWDEAHELHSEGRLQERLWTSICHACAANMSTPAFKKVWEMRRAAYRADFREFIDSLPDKDYVHR